MFQPLLPALGIESGIGIHILAKLNGEGVLSQRHFPGTACQARQRQQEKSQQERNRYLYDITLFHWTSDPGSGKPPFPGFSSSGASSRTSK